jgi:hypothetical protein
MTTSPSLIALYYSFVDLLWCIPQHALHRGSTWQRENAGSYSGDCTMVRRYLHDLVRCMEKTF